MKKTAIIVAGGTGSRMHSQNPKQFVPIGGIPMMAYSIKAFQKYDPEMEIVIAIHPNFNEQWQMISQETHIDKTHIKTVHGGSERFYSVFNALNEVRHPSGLVAVHDAARPFVSVRLIGSLFNHAEKAGCAVPALPIKDSLRAMVMGQWIVADRKVFRAIQTPQVFDIEKLKEAYQQPYMPKFTDDATVYESAGNKVYLIDGEENNIKITTDSDLGYAEYLVSGT